MNIKPDELTIKGNLVKDESKFLGLMRSASLIAVVVGAVGSVGFMLYVGRRNPSRLLILLFIIWVLSPFVALVLANVVSKHWAALIRAALYSMMVILTLVSTVIYGYVALGPPRPQPAFWFLVVPFVSWLLIAIVVPIAALISGKLSRHGNGD